MTNHNPYPVPATVARAAQHERPALRRGPLRLLLHARGARARRRATSSSAPTTATPGSRATSSTATGTPSGTRSTRTTARPTRTEFRSARRHSAPASPIGIGIAQDGDVLMANDWAVGIVSPIGDLRDLGPRGETRRLNPEKLKNMVLTDVYGAERRPSFTNFAYFRGFEQTTDGKYYVGSKTRGLWEVTLGQRRRSRRPRRRSPGSRTRSSRSRRPPTARSSSAPATASTRWTRASRSPASRA